jgi:hypothetical protein
MDKYENLVILKIVLFAILQIHLNSFDFPKMFQKLTIFTSFTANWTCIASQLWTQDFSIIVFQNVRAVNFWHFFVVQAKHAVLEISKFVKIFSRNSEIFLFTS